MAITETRQLPPKFIEELGTDLGTQLIAQSGRPTVAPGIDPATGKRLDLKQLIGESDADFAKRQQAAQEFDIRKQSIAGLAPTVADQTQLQKDAQQLAIDAAGKSGIASFQPFLTKAQDQADEASRLAGAAETGLAKIGTGAQAFQQDVQQFMSPYQSQVIDATLAEFDRNKQIQEQQIRDQQTALGALGSGRAGVQLAEFGTGAARERALLQAGLLQQGFNQAQAARQQDIANRFGVSQAQQGLGAFRSGLAGQQAQLGAQQQALQGTDISRLGQLGALNQAQAQAQLDATREATRMAAFQPQEELNRFADITTGIMGGMRGTGTATTNVPNPTPLQSALGVGTTLAGIYGAIKNPSGISFGFNT